MLASCPGVSSSSMVADASERVALRVAKAGAVALLPDCAAGSVSAAVVLPGRAAGSGLLASSCVWPTAANAAVAALDCGLASPMAKGVLLFTGGVDATAALRLWGRRGGGRSLHAAAVQPQW